MEAVDEEVEEFFGVLLAVEAPFLVESGAEALCFVSIGRDADGEEEERERKGKEKKMGGVP